MLGSNSLRPILLLMIGLICLPATGHAGSLPEAKLLTKPLHSPLLLQIQSPQHPGGVLLIYGVERPTGNQPQLPLLEQAWDNFHPTVAYSEGGVWPLWKTRRQAIHRNGEGGLLHFLANRDSIPIHSLEPPRSAEVGELRRQYTSDQIKVFYLLRQVPQFRRAELEEPLDSLALRLLERLSAVPGLESAPRNLAELEESCRRQYPHLADWRRVPAAWFDPARTYTGTNQMERDLDRIRDDNAVKLLAEIVNRGERIFVLAEGHRALLLAKALRQEVKKHPEAIKK